MRDYSPRDRQNWRPAKPFSHLSSSSAQKAALLALIILLQCFGCVFLTFYNSWRLHGTSAPIKESVDDQIVFHGDHTPANRTSLGGLTTTVRTYTAAELDRVFGHMDFIYTFANGSELNHVFRREMILACIEEVKSTEEDIYFSRPPRSRCSVSRIISNAPTNRDVLREVKIVSLKKPSQRDRERDELRYSIRSVEKHMRWHRGRLLIVSPGHHPSWIDAAKNFFSSACSSNRSAAEQRGQHRRITTVHQDAVMPYGMRLTVNSHHMELHIFRLRRITPIHLLLNDDYFVYRDVALSDLLNKHGGTYVRAERSFLQKATRATDKSSWISGVYNTNLFNAVELDHNAEDFIPPELLEEWRIAGHKNGSAIPVPNGDTLVHTARWTKVEELPEHVRPKRPRFFATHTPFVYCTRMFEFFSTRYEREIAHQGMNFRSRKSGNLLVPFVYNAFIMARPWQASPQFLPYVAALHASRRSKKPEPAPEPIHIKLDNIDGCALATLLRQPAASAVFTRFVDNEARNIESMRSIKNRNPLFFNINDDFISLNAAAQMQRFIRRLFPSPAFVERAEKKPSVGNENSDNKQHQHTRERSARDEKYATAYDALMQLPLVILTSYSEAFCPMVRSVHLALQNFRGPIALARAPLLHGPNLMADNIAALRAEHHHRVRNAMPVTKCIFNSHVSIVNVTAGGSLEDEIREAIAHSAEAKRAFDHAHLAARVPGDCKGPPQAAGKHVRAFVIDARATHAIDNVAALSRALQAPAQTLALEDFEPLELSGDVGAANGIALVLALRDAERRGIHWVNGAAEEDLLLTFPLASEVYEDLDAQVKWAL